MQLTPDTCGLCDVFISGESSFGSESSWLALVVVCMPIPGVWHVPEFKQEIRNKQG